MRKSYQGVMPKIADSAFIEASAHIIGDVEIGEHSSVWFNCVLRGDVFHIRIGDHTNIQDGTIIHVTSGAFPTIIGNRVTVGHGVILHGCQVQDGALIGIGSIILDEAVIGEESLVAAGSLVTPGTIIPPRSMVMGAPAKVRRQLRLDEVAHIQENWQHYVQLKDAYLSEA
ncbi:MAG: gamma carbonic anhydrase family protein [Acidobacteria bacterium]|nr:gamma carbonic anhydrase family protein [Acidobacteriota bacterium]